MQRERHGADMANYYVSTAQIVVSLGTFITFAGLLLRGGTVAHQSFMRQCTTRSGILDLLSAWLSLGHAVNWWCVATSYAKLGSGALLALLATLAYCYVVKKGHDNGVTAVLDVISLMGVDAGAGFLIVGYLGGSQVLWLVLWETWALAIVLSRFIIITLLSMDRARYRVFALYMVLGLIAPVGIVLALFPLKFGATHPAADYPY